MKKFFLTYQKIINIILIGIFLLSFVVPVYAQCTFPSEWTPSDGIPPGCKAQGVVPLTEYKPRGIQQYLTDILNIVFPILAIIAVLFIVMSGSKMVMNSHNETKAKEGQKGLTWAIIGLLATILAYAIITGTITWMYGLT